MTAIKKLRAFCEKGESYPSRLEIKNEIERLDAEEGDVKEFAIRPLFFQEIKNYEDAVNRIWKSGHVAIITVKKGDKYP